LLDTAPVQRRSKGAPPARQILDVIDAAYQVERSDAAWLESLALAARPHLDEGFGVAAFEYYKPVGGMPEIVRTFHVGIPDELEAIYRTVFETMDPEIRLRPFRMGPCIAGSQLMGMRQDFKEQPHMKRYVQTFGMYDSIWITAAEPSGYGVGFHSGRRKIGWATPSQVKRWGHIAAHLASAVRLKNLLRGTPGGVKPPEAVLDPSGRIHDATGPASTSAARELLRRAVTALEQSRGSIRVKDPDRSLAMRKALVGGRWSLIDEVDLDNRRYIVARENEPVAPGPESLSPREKQILGFAKLGHHNKLIAYELGIADSTVRVLLARAAAKIGVKTRHDLVARYEDRWATPSSRAGSSSPQGTRAEAEITGGAPQRR
jgi:DNA-binding CsgD family transcriptional regulator